MKNILLALSIAALILAVQGIPAPGPFDGQISYNNPHGITYQFEQAKLQDQQNAVAQGCDSYYYNRCCPSPTSVSKCLTCLDTTLSTCKGCPQQTQEQGIPAPGPFDGQISYNNPHGISYQLEEAKLQNQQNAVAQGCKDYYYNSCCPNGINIFKCVYCLLDILSTCDCPQQTQEQEIAAASRISDQYY